MTTALSLSGARRGDDTRVTACLAVAAGTAFAADEMKKPDPMMKKDEPMEK